MDQTEITEMRRLVARIAAAYASDQPVPARDLPELIATVHTGLLRIVDSPAEAGPRPAVPINQSVGRDHVVCLEDGKKFRSLKRHLAAAHGLTPAQYRERWGLPRAYPMVAPDYSRLRARVAKRTGLGGRVG